jgi:lysophospholipase L1-like esterase
VLEVRRSMWRRWMRETDTPYTAGGGVLARRGQVRRRNGILLWAGLFVLIVASLAFTWSGRRFGRWHVQTATFVALGDSWSDGTCATNKQTDNFAAVLAQHLPAGERFLNLGVPGIVLDQAIAFELPRALAAHPRFVTVWLADNDVGDGTALSHYHTSLNHLLSTLQQAHIRMFVANEPDLRLVPSYQGQLPFIRRGLAYNRVIAQATAAHGGVLVDIYPYTAHLWGRSDRVCQDGEHLNTQGYAALADIFYQVMHRSRLL